MGIEWIYCIATIVVGICAYYGGKFDGVNFGIEHTLNLLEKHKFIDFNDPKFEQTFGKVKDNV